MLERHWSLLSTRLVSDHVIFRLHQDRYQLDTMAEHRDFVRIDSPDWINVIPLTDDGQVVLVRQFRHGVRQVTLEIPGGMIDHQEDPAAAALRELREETGYAARACQSLGSIWPNPAIQNNRCHMFLATGAHYEGPPTPDEAERIEVVCLPLDDIPRLLAQREIDHSLVVAAFAMWGVTARGRVQSTN